MTVHCCMNFVIWRTSISKNSQNLTKYLLWACVFYMLYCLFCRKPIYCMCRYISGRISCFLWSSCIDRWKCCLLVSQTKPPLDEVCSYFFLSPTFIYWASKAISKQEPVFDLIVCIGECPSIAPFLENNGPRPRKGPRSIVFKEWNDTRTFAYVKSTHRLQPLPQYL